MAVTTARSSAPAGPRSRVRRWARGFRERDTWWAYAFLTPWLFGFIVFTAGPMVASAVLSFTNYSVISATHGVGLANYRALAHDPYVLESLKNTLIMTAMYVPADMLLSLLLATLLARATRMGGFFRTIFYLPVMTPTVAIGSMYLLIFNGNYGLLDRALSLIGIHGPFWQTDPNWIKPGIVVMLLWQVGTNTVLYLAAIKNVPQHLYEAAAMDGASAWRRFRDVTLPMISPTLFFTFIILTIYGFQIFDQIYTAFYNPSNINTSSDSSLTYVIYLFQQAFQYFHLGYASALAWVLFGLIMIVTIVQVVVSRRFVYYEGGR
ncbi:MAG TPA: sugar ABC transporter permease [Solirubrobacteraceae bacterium]|jgi:multiple sugar transport system permease protein|nr:sugar ABC transporter permease [Solirubrobacteraceae bacterium]